MTVLLPRCRSYAAAASVPVDTRSAELMRKRVRHTFVPSLFPAKAGLSGARSACVTAWRGCFCTRLLGATLLTHPKVKDAREI